MDVDFVNKQNLILNDGIVQKKNRKLKNNNKNKKINFLNDWKKNNEMVCSETIQEQKRKKKKNNAPFSSYICLFCPLNGFNTYFV